MEPLRPAAAVDNQVTVGGCRAMMWVVSSLGSSGPTASRPTAAPPPAARAALRGWRDPRLWAGVLIVTASVVVGARVLASADDTVAVWAVTEDLGPGDRVGPDDLTARRVRFAEPADLDRYFTASEQLPADLELVRGLGEGELLPRAAVAAAGGADVVHLRIAVSDEQVPASVRTGSRVHVHVRSGSGARAKPAAGEPVLAGATVVAAPPAAENLAATGNRSIDLAVTEEEAQQYFSALAQVDDPVLTVVRVGG